MTRHDAFLEKRDLVFGCKLCNFINRIGTLKEYFVGSCRDHLGLSFVASNEVDRAISPLLCKHDHPAANPGGGRVNQSFSSIQNKIPPLVPRFSSP
jgi:hypothetical protein